MLRYVLLADQDLAAPVEQIGDPHRLVRRRDLGQHAREEVDDRLVAPGK